MAAPERKKHFLREKPEHADEGQQEQGRLQQADQQVGDEIREMLCIRRHPLIGVRPDSTCIRQTVSPQGLQPLVQQVVHQ